MWHTDRSAESCIPGETNSELSSKSQLWSDGISVQNVQNVLTAGESQYLIKQADRSGSCKRSEVISEKGNKQDNIRTSTSCFLKKGNDPIQSCIERKLAAEIGVSQSRLEPLQVTKYKGPRNKQKGQLYKPHYDAFTTGHKKGEPQRTDTLFVYLQDCGGPSCGGATVFPLIQFEDGTPLKVIPKKGDGVLWQNTLRDEENSVNVLSLHGGEEVLCSNQEKIGLNVWARDKDYV